jgi:hypothetical protein
MPPPRRKMDAACLEAGAGVERVMAPEPPSAEVVLLATQNWVERAVIGLGLCPFARAVQTKSQVRYCVSLAEQADALLTDLRRELLELSQADPCAVETTLMIAPRVLTEFRDYNAFLERAAGLLEELDLTGVLQIASFHPDYQFGDLDSDDVANCSNRSPYPCLHLLREASVTRAVASFPEADRIFEKNIATLRALGHEGWARILTGSLAT